MRRFVRIAAYCFLALMGITAWDTYQEGWRHYFGMALFFVATVRLMTLMFPKKGGRPDTGDAGSGEEKD